VINSCVPKKTSLASKSNLAKTTLTAGLPDGTFSNQKSQFGQILEGLRMENFGIFYALLEYITYIL
jgi:hypothetical protein